MARRGLEEEWPDVGQRRSGQTWVRAENEDDIPAFFYSHLNQPENKCKAKNIKW